MLLYSNLVVAVIVSYTYQLLPAAAFVAPSIRTNIIGTQALPAHGGDDIKPSIIGGNFRDEQCPNDSTTIATQPRVALSIIEYITKWFIKYILLSKGSESPTVHINALSNRAILKGNISKLSISARNCIFRFKLLSFRRLDINGVNLQLGYLPLLLPILPYILWSLRRYIRRVMMTLFLLQITGYFDSDKVRKQFGSVKERLHKFIGSPRPPSVNYSIAIASDDIENSLLLRFWLRTILQSLVQNSVVGAAAALGDAARQSIEAEKKRIRNNETLFLPGSVAVSNILSHQEKQQQQGLTSALLSATSFELENTRFMEDRIVFDAKAVLPKDENGVTNSLQFCIRAKLAPTTILDEGGDTLQLQNAQEEYNAVGFLNPECRLATNPLYSPVGSSSLLKQIVPNLIPEYIWLPFGMGVAIPLGRDCRIYRANISPDKEVSGCICKIDGSINDSQTRLQ